MTAAIGRPTDDPKSIRMEIRLSENDQKMLDFCAEVYGQSKGEVLRMALAALHEQAGQYQAEQERKMTIEEAEEERENMVYEDAYNEAFEEAYTEEYSKLIRNPDYAPSDAKEAATDYAKDIAKDAAKEAVKEFWQS